MQVSIAGFEIEAEIGRGGFGVVYRARQLDFGRLAAIKVLLPGATPEELQRRFAQECRAIGALRPHPNIVTVYSTGSTDAGEPYLAMQYLGGGSLAQRVPLAAGAVAALGARLADGLGVAHAGGVIHRDVKPANILFDDDAEPVLVDFGISALTGDGSTTSSDVALSVAYAPPEVLHGDRATSAADVYALGATLFAAVTGRTPFADPDGATPIARLATRILHEQVEDLRPSGVPDALCAVIERCMAKDPAQRYATMADVRAALLPVEGDAVLLTPAQLWGGPTTTVSTIDPEATSRRVPRPASRRPRRTAIAVAAAVLLGGGIAAAAVGSGDDRQPTSRDVAAAGTPSVGQGETATGSTASPETTPASSTAAGSPAARSSASAGRPRPEASTAPPPQGSRRIVVSTPRPGRTATRTVTLPPPDRAPVLANIPPFSANEARRISTKVTATDPDGDPVRFTVTGLPRGLHATSSGAISGTVASNASSVTTSYHTLRSQRFTITVTAIDPAGKKDVATKTWTVRDTLFVMPNYYGLRGCDGDGSCHESVRNFRELGPHSLRCRKAATRHGRIIAQSLAAGRVGTYGRTNIFYVSKSSC